jgi:hypothetical protein
MTTLAAVMLATMLSAGPASSQSDALTRARVNAYLGSESTTAEDWRQLDASAVPFLTKVIGDRDESPSRRVRAMAGLSLLGSRNDIRSLMDLARAEGEAVQIRIVALRYAMSRYAKGEAVGLMKGLLRDSQVLRIRIIAAEQLTRLSRSSGCTAVRAQVEKERPRDQKSFQRALARCPPPPPEPAPKP